MKAIILAAGLGQRLRPLTYYINKGLVPVNGIPILEHILRKLKKQGFSEFIIAVSHLGEQVVNYFDSGAQLGIKITYSQSKSPLGTAGEIFQMKKLLADEKSFLVHYGDILTNLDIPGMIKFHRRRRSIATVGFVTNLPIHFGTATLKNGLVTEFTEKPPLRKPCHAAVQIFNPEALKHMKKGEDIAHHTIPRMIAKGEKVGGFFDRKAYWQDMGRLSDLDDANEFLKSLKKKQPPRG